MLGILILNQNGVGWLPVIYESIQAQGYPHVRVYLVDNASTDRSVELTLTKHPEVMVIRMPQNLGYCMAYNLAMPFAFADGCEWIVWANNDIRLEPGCLEKLARVTTVDPRIGVLGPGFLAWDVDEPNYYMIGNHPYALGAMKARSREVIDVEWVEGSFLMVSRRCFLEAGPLDPYLFFYWEETDFCRRARFCGWRVVLVPQALARHYAGGWSQGSPQNTLKKNWLQNHNYYIYHLSNPFQGFSRNMLDAAHLFLVHMKSYFPKETSSVKSQIQVFGKVIRELPTIYKKWDRDRKGDHPPIVTDEFKSIHPEIMSRTSVKNPNPLIHYISTQTGR